MGRVHCFSVDVEGFCEGCAESIAIPAHMIRSQQEKSEIERNEAPKDVTWRGPMKPRS